MKIDKRGDKVVYIEIDGWTFYIDHSTGEAIMEKWETKEERQTHRCTGTGCVNRPGCFGWDAKEEGR